MLHNVSDPRGPLVADFQNATAEIIAPVLTRIGFQSERFIDGGSYVASLYSRNGWGALVHYEWRENYFDIRVASDIQFAAFGMNLLLLARRMALDTTGYESSVFMPLRDRLVWWRDHVLEPLSGFLKTRTNIRTNDRDWLN